MPGISKDGPVPKSEVNYRPAESATRRCGTCVHFKRFVHGETGRCQIVLGEIHPDDVCDRYQS
jgi:hypothetical protein